MENVGFEPTKVHGTLHGPGYSGDHGISSVYTNPTGRVADAFHIFAAEWEPNVIRFYMDGQLYATRTPAVLPAGQRWVYDHPFFIILNLAIGCNWPRNPDNSTIFPQRMLVDYVRVYARKLTTSASTSEKLTTRVYARKADYIRVYARKSTTSTPETLTTSTSTPEKLNTSACTLEIKNASEVEASLDHRPCRGPIDALRCD
jgi:beta-glucanase (GH16 family)